MKQYYFPVFITLFGLFTAYVFYTLWHSEEVNPVKIKVEKKKIKEKSLENKLVIPKRNNINVKEVKPTVLTPQKIEKFQTQDMVEDEAKKVYEVLIPESQPIFLEEAKEAFETLDVEVSNMESRLIDEEKRRNTLEY